MHECFYIYLEAEFLPTIKQRLESGVARFFADPQTGPSMSGDAKDTTQLKLNVSGLFCQIKGLDGVVDESAVRTQYAYLELAFVDRPPPTIQFVRLSHAVPFDPLDPYLQHRASAACTRP
jgi:hypothetical protein